MIIIRDLLSYCCIDGLRRAAFGKLLRQSLPSEQGEDTQQHQYASVEMSATIDVIVPLNNDENVQKYPTISANSVLKK